MKRRMLLAAGMLALLPACQVKADLAMDVNRDGSGNVAVSTGLDDEMLQAARSQGTDPFAGVRSQAPPGWKVEQWKAGAFQGVRMSHAFSRPGELSSLLRDFGKNPGPTVEHLQLTHAGNAFELHGTLPPFNPAADALTQSAGASASVGAQTSVPAVPASPFAPPGVLPAPSGVPGSLPSGSVSSGSFSSGSVSSGSGLSTTAGPFNQSLSESLNQVFKVSFSLHLPGKVVHSNATRVEGGHLVWEIRPGAEATHISARSEVPAGPHVPLSLVALGSVAVLTVAGALVVSRRALPL